MFLFFPKFKNNKIKIFRPRPFQKVGAKFIISGKIPKTWLETRFGGINNSIGLELIDINARTVMGTSFYLGKKEAKSWFLKFKKRLYFLNTFQFSDLNIGFIKESQGRMTIKLSGQNENEQSIYLPVIVKFFEPKGGASPEIINKHGKIGKTIKQYNEDLKTYYQGLDKIQERRIIKNEILKEDEEKMNQYAGDWSIVGGVLEILNQAENFNDNYPFTQEDLEEKQLGEKYKDALKWQGPLLGGAVGRMDGFEFRIYNNDHDKHFHVIHKGKGINARFSFPKIELINYKTAKTSINRKEKDKIISFFQEPDNIKRLEHEFQRREHAK